MKTLFIIDYSTDWKVLFPKDRVKVIQTAWSNIAGVSGDVVIVDVPGSESLRVTNIDLMMIRNFPSLLHGGSYRNVVLGLLQLQVPCVNSLSAVLRGMDRIVEHVEMTRVGLDVIPIKFYSNHRGASGLSEDAPGYPCVVKVGSVDAGYGKSLLKDESSRADLWSILVMTHDFVTEERFFEHEYEYRIQCIGAHIRCFKRVSTTWKNNTGNVQFEDIEVLPKHHEMVKKARNMYGGLDIFALDVLHAKSGEETILEINAGSNGLMWRHEKEDNTRIRDLVMNKLYPSGHWNADLEFSFVATNDENHVALVWRDENTWIRAGGGCIQVSNFGVVDYSIHEEVNAEVKVQRDGSKFSVLVGGIDSPVRVAHLFGCETCPLRYTTAFIGRDDE